MKKKFAVLTLAAALMAVPTFSFAAGSKGYYDNDSDDSSSSSSTTTTTTTSTTTTVGSAATAQNTQPGSGVSGTSVPTTTTEVHVAADGSTVSTTGTTVDKTGTTIGLVLTTTTTGTAVQSNNMGGTTIGSVTVSFVSGVTETQGLPTEVASQINSLNEGKSVAEVLGNVSGMDLTGYQAVGNTRAINAVDAATGLTNTPVEISMYVSAVDTVDMAAVYYDNNTGTWVAAPVVVDPVTKTVRFTIPGSCTVQLVKKS